MPVPSLLAAALLGLLGPCGTPDADLKASPSADEETRASIAEACAILGTDVSATEALPGAYRYLCTDAPAPSCSERGGSGCLSDSTCYRRFGSSNCEPGDPGPCLPDYVFKACEPIPKPRLAHLVRHRRDCQASGGVWVPTPQPTERFPGVCNCMPTSAAGVAWSNGGDAGLPDQPVSYYVAGRGCVLERSLCAEIGGEWVEDPRRDYCMAAGASVDWSARGIAIGIRE